MGIEIPDGIITFSVSSDSIEFVIVYLKQYLGFNFLTDLCGIHYPSNTVLVKCTGTHHHFGHIGEPRAFVGGVEEKRRAEVGHSGHGLQKMMDAFDDHPGVGFRPGDGRAENGRVVDQMLLDDGGGLEALGHDVVGHQAGAFGQGQCRPVVSERCV